MVQVAQHLPERVAHIEGWIEGVNPRLDRIETRIEDLSGHIEEQGMQLSARMDSLDGKIDRFRDELSGRIDEQGRLLSARIDEQGRLLSARIDEQGKKFDRMTLLLIATLLGVLGQFVLQLFKA